MTDPTHNTSDPDLDAAFDDELDDDELEDSLEAELRRALLSEGPVEGSSVLVTSSLLDRVVAGKYRIKEQLGQGGMGQVFIAEHVDTRGPVVVKVMRKLGDPQTLKRFQIEATNAAALQHPNTIRVTDSGVDDEMPFLIMEYVEGVELTELINNGPIPWRRAANIASQVLSALWAAHHHERRIIHRDIKPANILVTDQPGIKDFVKVLDFGISRALEATGAGTEGIVGTPYTVAPEQWTGHPISPQTDLYSLGCTFYEMIAGSPPFTGKSVIEIGQGHMDNPPPPLHPELAAAVPDALFAWTLWLLEKDPRARPESAALAIDSLKAIVENPDAPAELVKDPEAMRDAPRQPAANETPPRSAETAVVTPIRRQKPDPPASRVPLALAIALVILLVLVLLIASLELT